MNRRTPVEPAADGPEAGRLHPATTIAAATQARKHDREQRFMGGLGMIERIQIEGEKVRRL